MASSTRQSTNTWVSSPLLLLVLLCALQIPSSAAQSSSAGPDPAQVTPIGPLTPSNIPSTTGTPIGPIITSVNGTISTSSGAANATAVITSSANVTASSSSIATLDPSNAPNTTSVDTASSQGTSGAAPSATGTSGSGNSASSVAVVQAGTVVAGIIGLLSVSVAML
ncbi:unnamed protein product [Sympodiomycopsis kandeliae]